MFGCLKGEMTGFTANLSAGFFLKSPDIPGNHKKDSRGCVWRVDRPARVENKAQRGIVLHGLKEIQHPLK
jgi:hypothetical protein